MSAAPVPAQDLERVDDAQRRFEHAIVKLDDAAVKRPSALPGWSVAHVLTHVARNADSHIRRAEAAIRGEVVDQYPGGFEGRARDIENGSRRTAAELIGDVEQSAARLRDVWRATPEEAWRAITRDVGGRERPLHALPARRWQELEVHLIDLDIGVTFRDWPDLFVSEWLPRLRAGLGDRMPAGWTAPPTATLDGREELAWLYGRLRRDDLPVLAPWG